MSDLLIPRDLLRALDRPDLSAELRAEVIEQGEREIADLITYGDPLECDGCLCASRLRHCERCHT